jgi:hypothetical protein
LAVVIVVMVRVVIAAVGISIVVRISVETEPQAAEETVVPHAEATVHTGEAAVKSTKSPVMETAKPAAVKPTAKPATVKSPTPASAMRAGVGEIRLTEGGSAE